MCGLVKKPINIKLHQLVKTIDKHQVASICKNDQEALRNINGLLKMHYWLIKINQQYSTCEKWLTIEIQKVSNLKLVRFLNPCKKHLKKQESCALKENEKHKKTFD